jgi:hypothetical protein
VQFVGWTNNPANPLWKANRVPFLQSATNPSGDDYSHAAHPQDWPYQEKVIGWAARPISAMFAPGDFQAGYRPAWWTTNTDRTNAKPPVDQFCNASNYCDPSKIGDNDSNDQGLGACTADAGDSDTNPHWLHCWWHEEITEAQWKSCGRLAECGNAVHRFSTSYGEQADAGSYPPNCSTTGLPAHTLVVDDLPDGTTPAGVDGNRGCGAVKSSGTFNFTFVPWDTQMDLTHDGTDNPTTVTTYPGKIDTHQIGAGYGNHFWFTHTRTPESYPANAYRMKVTGTWKLNAPLTNTTRQAKVFVHVPDHGAQTTNAVYRIQTPTGERTASISQKSNQSNKWVSLGAYDFGDQIPEVQLDNAPASDGVTDATRPARAGRHHRSPRWCRLLLPRGTCARRKASTSRTVCGRRPPCGRSPPSWAAARPRSAARSAATAPTAHATSGTTARTRPRPERTPAGPAPSHARSAGTRS